MRGQIQGPVPARAGIGLRARHHAEIVRERPAIAWFEAHSENYFAPGGALPEILESIRNDYPLSLHGVGLGLGNTGPLDRGHLAALRRLIERYQPALVSEHACWGAFDGRFTNDLLPMPYTEEALRHLAARVRETQETLGREILIENVSSYLEFRSSEIPEWDFMAALASEAGCGILLDVNNIYVSAMNHGFDPVRYLNAIPRRAVKEMHLAGHSINHVGDREIRIDTHGAHVCDAVWGLYRFAVGRFGAIPTLIEWDTDIPALHVLQAEAARADAILESHYVAAA
ncbi:MAG: DUF692 domain-containing protein [Steroidobacteraceae bacterium]